MKKFVIPIILIALIAFSFSFKAYHLQDGYYLQGFKGYGYLSKNYIKPIITAPILGIQGSKKGFIYGWTPTENKIKYFIISTKSQKLEWLSNFEELNKKCDIVGIQHLDMKKETNFSALKNGTRHFQTN